MSRSKSDDATDDTVPAPEPVSAEAKAEHWLQVVEMLAQGFEHLSANPQHGFLGRLAGELRGKLDLLRRPTDG